MVGDGRHLGQNNIKENIRTLFLDGQICGTFYKSLIMFVVTFCSFYLAVFMLNNAPGSLNLNFVALGIAIASGILLSAQLNAYMKDYHVYILGLCTMFIATIVNEYLLNNDELSPAVMHALVFARFAGVGVLMNSQLMVLSSRMYPHLISSSLEICFCFANLCAGFTPIFAKMAAPTPNVTLCGLCVLGIITALNFKGTGEDYGVLQFQDNLSDLQQSVISSMLSENEDLDDPKNDITQERKKQKRNINQVLAKKWVGS